MLLSLVALIFSITAISFSLNGMHFDKCRRQYEAKKIANIALYHIRITTERKIWTTTKINGTNFNSHVYVIDNCLATHEHTLNSDEYVSFLSFIVDDLCGYKLLCKWKASDWFYSWFYYTHHDRMWKNRWWKYITIICAILGQKRRNFVLEIVSNDSNIKCRNWITILIWSPSSCWDFHSNFRQVNNLRTFGTKNCAK